MCRASDARNRPLGPSVVRWKCPPVAPSKVCERARGALSARGAEQPCRGMERRDSDEEAVAADEGGASEQHKVVTFEIGAPEHGGGHLRQMHKRLGHPSWLLTNDESMQDEPRVEVVPRSVGFAPPVGVETISIACETHRPSIVHFAMHGSPDPPSAVLGFAVQIGPPNERPRVVVKLEPGAIRKLRGLNGCFVFSGGCRTGTDEFASAFFSAGAIGYMAPRDCLVIGKALGDFKTAILVKLSELAGAGGLADGQRANALVSEVLAATGDNALRLHPKHGKDEMSALRSYCTWTEESGKVVCRDIGDQAGIN